MSNRLEDSNTANQPTADEQIIGGVVEIPDVKARGGGQAASVSKLTLALRAFKHKNYQLFFGGQLISLTGTWMQIVAQSWLVYRLTGSPAMLGFVGFCGQIPVFLLASLGGAFADRHHRRNILVFTQTASMLLAFVLAGLTLMNLVQVWHVFALASLLGMVNALDIPTRQAFVVDMVGKEDVINAVALNSTMFNSARIIGPAVAGVLLETIGEGWCFFVNAVSYFAVITGLLLMKVSLKRQAGPHNSALASIVEGFHYVAHTRPVRALLLMLGVFSLLAMPYIILMPIFADKILHHGAGGLGLLMGASGVGALAGALTLATKEGVHGLGRWVALSAVGFGVGLILFSMSRWFWISATLLLPVGFAMLVQMASSNTLIQVMVPDNLRGRVMAVYSMMFMGMAPFGALLAGAIAQHLGAPTTLKIGGLVCIVAAMIFWSRLPALRYEARQLIISNA